MSAQVEASRHRALVIGSGFGGLAAACHLAEAGLDVQVLEKNEQPGGRASRLRERGFVFDMGPSWYLMPDVFERFFRAFGQRPEDHYELLRLDPRYRIFFKDGDRVDLPADLAACQALFERYEPGAGERLARYLEASRRTYEASMAEFVTRDRSLRELLEPGLAAQIGDVPLLGSLERHVSRAFRHPKLRQIMQYSLVFLGGAPRSTPALYSLMSHVDFGLGVHYPIGGIGAVVDALVALARERGVRLSLDTEVTGIARGPNGLRVTSATTRWDADVVVSNTHVAHTELDLLPRDARSRSARYWRRRRYAPSAFLLYLGVEGDVEELAHHTLVLPTDWDPHFAEIFDRPAWPSDPAYYVCAPSRTDPGVAPPGHTNLFLLVPIAPGLADTPELRRACRDATLADLATHTGVDLRPRIVLEHAFCIRDFAARYHSPEGSALGLAHTLRQSAFFRPPQRAARVPGLYYAGADTRPGIGMPMCLISGELCAAKALEDLGR